MKIRDVETFPIRLGARIPFRYGMLAKREVTHLLLKVTLETGAGIETGFAADHLLPRWFRNELPRPFDEEEDELFDVVLVAVENALALPAFGTPFAGWRALWEAQSAVASSEGWPPLLAHFGTSLIERAMLDAYSRQKRVPLWRLLRGDAGMGIDLGVLDPSLSGARLKNLLPDQPLPRITVRHTIGLEDPLTDAEVAERPDDGFPVSLMDNISRYGLRSFKIKVGGDPARDIARLEEISSVVVGTIRGQFSFTLDGDERFPTREAFREFGAKVLERPNLNRFFEHLRFIEQPFPRDRFDCSPVEAWPEPAPVIMDEGDGDLSGFPAAVAAGYAGVSHRNCKGVFKGLRNACLVAMRRRLEPGKLWLTSGEDLSNIGPVALPQDLAVQAALGNGDVERNGHHHFAGMAGFPRAMAAAAAVADPDLFVPDPFFGVRIRIEHGMIDLAGVNAAPFGIDLNAETLASHG